MPTYKLEIDFGDPKCLNFETQPGDLLKAGLTYNRLKYAFESYDRDKQIPEIKIYKDGKEQRFPDFEHEFSLLMKEKRIEYASENFLRPSQVRKIIGPDLEREMLLRWTRAGLIYGELGKIGKKSVYMYPKSQITRISEMLRLVKEGYSPKSAALLIQKNI
jgi:hypothetical protein